LKFFRIISLLEGISYLVILSVSLEIISRDYVFHLGMTHGVLFLAYLIFSLQASHKQGWSIFVWLLIFLAAIVPFAFIGVDIFLQKEMKKQEAFATA
jgi:integral membrane protein